MRPRELMRLAVIAVIAILSVSAAEAALQGVWEGTVSFTDDCGAIPLQITSPARFFIAAAEGDFVGNLVIDAVPVRDTDCTSNGVITMVAPVTGQSTDQSSFTGTIILPAEDDIIEGTVSGSISGTSMTVSVGGEGLASSGTFTQTSSQQPPTQFSGAYAGSVTSRPACPNGSFVTEGTAQGGVIHTAEALSGFLLYSESRHVDQDGGGSCFYHDVPSGGVVMVMARVNGNALTGALWPIIESTDGEGNEEDSSEILPFTATVSGDTIAGSSSGGEANVTFTLTRSGDGGAPIITAFAAEPPVITEPGQAVRLVWSTLNASSVAIDQGIGQQPASGFLIVRPQATTTYTLTASGSAGSVTAQTTVTLGAAAPRVVVARPPDGFVQRAGEGGGVDRFVVANIGLSETTVTLSGSGSFFTFSPSTVTLPARSAQIITISGIAQPAGAYQGTISLAGEGVPESATLRVRMLSAAPPDGPVDPRPLRARVAVRTGQGESGSGSIGFRNNGTATLHAIAISDVPFIVPETGVITVPPGGVGSVSFTIDPSLRPADRALGALNAKLSLVFLRGGSGAMSNTLGGAAPATSTVSVTLVHVVNPGVSSGAPPPLTAGQLAKFAAGLGNTEADSGDLFISSAAPAGVSDLELYLSGAAGNSQRATLPPLAANAAFSFPSVVGSAYGSTVANGTAQVRSSSLPDVALAATRVNAAASEGTYGTALPVFRSDRGFGASNQAILSGVLDAGSVQTDLVVQELTGNNGSFEVDFLSSNGTVIGTRPRQSLAPFAFAKIEDVVPAAAVAARVRNTSSGAVRLGAYGVVVHPTGDVWTITDPSLETAEGDTLIIPIVSAGAGAETVLFATNASASTTTVTVDVRGSRPSRRRAVGRTTATSGSVLRARRSETTTHTLAPLQSTTIDIEGVSDGYVRLSSSNAAIAASARSVREDQIGRMFGTGLPVLPASAGLGAGASKRFAGIEDASAESRSGAVPATFRTDLLLIEGGGASAKVRVTLHYIFATGLVSSEAASSREFELSAGQFLRVADIARAIIGPQRDSFGDLRNMTLDIEVVEGSGRVLSFVHSIDNGSGDSMIRHE